MQCIYFRRNAQYNATSSTSIHSYQQHATSSTSSANMQLMPYTAQTKTLNPDELSKLYNMNPYNRPTIPPNMVNYPSMPAGIALNHQQNQTTNIANQMSLAQASLNTAQYMTTMPYLHNTSLQQGIYHNYVFSCTVKSVIEILKINLSSSFMNAK